MKKLRVDIWSDIVCPWCAIGSRRFAAALARFEHRDDVDVVWRSFELDPRAPTASVVDNATRLAKKYGTSREDAVARMEQIEEIAARDGLLFDLVNARPGNTFDAHRVLHLARERGLGEAVKERFFAACHSEREPIGEHEVLVRLGSEAGLDADEIVAALAGDRHAAHVREEEAIARRLGIEGVPFFLFGGTVTISGAQSPDILAGGLEQAWNRAAPESSPVTVW
jgi:predicted DsbA family dithiol-disulfide isomerase